PKAQSSIVTLSHPLHDALQIVMARAAQESGDPIAVLRAGFEDRAVAGRANPTGVSLDAWRDGDMMLADVTLHAAFEGAPGRAHRSAEHTSELQSRVGLGWRFMV